MTNPLQPIIDAVGDEATDILLAMVAIAAEHMQRQHGQTLAEGAVGRAELAQMCEAGLRCGARTVQDGGRCCRHRLTSKGIG